MKTSYSLAIAAVLAAAVGLVCSIILTSSMLRGPEAKLDDIHEYIIIFINWMGYLLPVVADQFITDLRQA